MNTHTITKSVVPRERLDAAAGVVDEDDDPFDLDITFIENTPATETLLTCSTGDNCGSSCPSACTTS